MDQVNLIIFEATQKKQNYGPKIGQLANKLADDGSKIGQLVHK